MPPLPREEIRDLVEALPAELRKDSSGIPKELLRILKDSSGSPKDS